LPLQLLAFFCYLQLLLQLLAFFAACNCFCRHLHLLGTSVRRNNFELGRSGTRTCSDSRCSWRCWKFRRSSPSRNLRICPVAGSAAGPLCRTCDMQEIPEGHKTVRARTNVMTIFLIKIYEPKTVIALNLLAINLI
jgi:hypothetical protein